MEVSAGPAWRLWEGENGPSEVWKQACFRLPDGLQSLREAVFTLPEAWERPPDPWEGETASPALELQLSRCRERRFLSSAATGRRVSFNEAALFEQSKSRRREGGEYTLTEGDFHHLKNARLSHLPLPPSAALKIVTIHECEANENSVMMTPPTGSPLPKTALTSHGGLCSSSTLPGDTFNSSIEAASSVSSDSSGSAAKAVKGAPMAPPQELPSAPAQGTVLHFLTRLRRHASLEGASPYFRIKKWKLETSQRASSLDTRVPKRHQFQRQRAASESMDQDRDPHQTDIIQYIARTDDVVFRPVAGPFLPAPASPTLSLGRYFSVKALEMASNSSPTSPPLKRLFPKQFIQMQLDIKGTEEEELDGEKPLEQQPTPFYHDIWSLRASLEKCVSSEKGNNQDSAPSDGGDSVSSSSGLPKDKSLAKPKQDSVELEAGTRKLLQMDSGYASIEAPSGRVGEDQTEEEEEEEEETMFPARESFPRRDYSIDEKTDALFNAFVRHDPQFDESPLRAKHRSRTHLRKQWQRTKQYSDPGIRYPTALERHRTPLRRGDSVNYPLEGRYHSTLPRIVSSGDEEVASRRGNGGEDPGD
uniref:CACN subunit beta associated regulatory protein n=1 Tax=Naja naja TaxID=35670 RepID=A0A8C6XU07_NAJNA